jgi:hypothetical protein
MKRHERALQILIDKYEAEKMYATLYKTPHPERYTSQYEKEMTKYHMDIMAELKLSIETLEADQEDSGEDIVMDGSAPEPSWKGDSK